jgi:1,4-dihydroxy-2-naphthoate octaprenyltransferase
MTVRTFCHIVELRTKVVSVSTFLTASLFAYVTTGLFSLPRFAVMAVAVLCVDMGTTAFNSYFDYVNGTDRAQDNWEADKVLVHRGIAPSSALLIALSLFALAAIFGICLAWETSWLLIIAGGVSMIVGFCYTGGPYPISRTPFGELFAGGFLGSVLFVISFYVQTLYFDGAPMVASLPFFLLVGMILTVNNSCDRVSDARAGRRTLSVVLGERWAARLPAVELFLAYTASLCLWAFGIYPGWALIGIAASLPLCLWVFRSMAKAGFSARTKSSSMRRVSLLYGLFCLCFIAGLVVILLVR